MAWIDFHLQMGRKDLRQGFERAIELAPGYAEAHHWYGWYLLGWQEFSEAEAEMMRARELDPLSPVINQSLGSLFLRTSQYDRAIEHLKATLDLDPDLPGTHHALGLSYLFGGDVEAGLKYLHQAAELSQRNPQYVASLSLAYGKAGNKSEAQGIVAELVREAEATYVSPLFLAVAHLGAGEVSAAIQQVRRAVETDAVYLCWIRSDPRFAELGDDAEFQALVRRVWP
jgi:tetratricopeptide (TPR) repeat protein